MSTIALEFDAIQTYFEPILEHYNYNNKMK